MAKRFVNLDLRYGVHTPECSFLFASLTGIKRGNAPAHTMTEYTLQCICKMQCQCMADSVSSRKSNILQRPQVHHGIIETLKAETGSLCLFLVLPYQLLCHCCQKV